MLLHRSGGVNLLSIPDMWYDEAFYPLRQTNFVYKVTYQAILMLKDLCISSRKNLCDSRKQIYSSISIPTTTYNSHYYAFIISWVDMAHVSIQNMSCTSFVHIVYMINAKKPILCTQKNNGNVWEDPIIQSYHSFNALHNLIYLYVIISHTRSKSTAFAASNIVIMRSATFCEMR